MIERHYRLWLVVVWLASAAVAVAFCWGTIVALDFPDPDDTMRLVEVRDWMAGQSWIDVSQHRMNQPDGLSMHWSRLLDVPIAALIALTRPLVGTHIAEMFAAAVIPMVTLGIAMALVAEIARRRSGARAALLAAASCMLSVGTWYAMRPLRIDHHGWQVVAGLGLVLALVARRDLRGAALAGGCAALWTHISLEGLVFTAGAAAWLGLRGIAEAAERFRLPVFLGAAAGAGAILYLAVHGTGMIARTFCDQISPLHLAVFTVATTLTFAGARFAPRSIPARAGALALAAIACIAVYRLGAPQCAAGPFGTLGPLGRTLWIANIYEGVPVWHMPLPLTLVWGLFPLVGLAGALVACFEPAGRRAETIDYCALLAVATMIGLLVTRAGAFSNLLAIPGAITLIMLALERTETWRMPARIVARALALLVLSPDGAGLAALLVPDHPGAPPPARSGPYCGRIGNLRPLDRFAATTIIVPLNMGPALLVGTHHAAVTGPYHRDPAAMEDVLGFFTADDTAARAIARRRRAGYAAFCASDGEMDAMAKFAPHGLAARFLRGEPVGWLAPVAVPGTAGLTVYRVLD